jgi:hypothetical protein
MVATVSVLASIGALPVGAGGTVGLAETSIFARACAGSKHAVLGQDVCCWPILLQKSVEALPGQ